MSLSQLNIPEVAKDIKLNLSTVLKNEEILARNQVLGVALAVGYALKNKELVEAILQDGAEVLSDQEKRAASGAATLMAMNNVYYRFVHLVEDQKFSQLPAKLRMQLIGNPGIEKADFELYSLAVSAVNGCGMCMKAHVNELRKHGLSDEQIQASIRIASVLNATSQSLF